MTGLSGTDEQTRLVMLAAIDRARLAPSVHNTQPWLFRLTDSGADLLGDNTRRLRALDPTGRELTLSCGAALFHLRLALMSAGYTPRVTLFPVAGHPELIARIDPGLRGERDSEARQLDACADDRQTNRRGYAGHVSDDAVVALQTAAETEGAGLQVVSESDDQTSVKVWQQRANAEQTSSPAYRRELHSWVTGGRNDDGIPLTSTLEPSGGAHDLAPRDFAFDQLGGIPEDDGDEGARLLVLFTEADTPTSWVAAGQALARLWLEATLLGLVLQPLSQSVEIPGTRLMLREGLRLMDAWPQLVLRVGHAPAQPRTPRRAVGEITLGSLSAHR